MTTVPPPAGAVARDPHWAAKMDRLRARKPLERSVTLFDDEAADALSAAKMRYDQARADAARRHPIPETEGDPAQQAAARVAHLEAVNTDPLVVAARAAVEQAQADADDRDVTFAFRGLPADVLEALIAAHPPTEDQVDAGQVYNVKRFAPALLAACSVNPMTEHDAAELVGGEVVDADGTVTRYQAVLTQGEASLLFSTAIGVNQGARASVGKGSRPTLT